MYIIAYTNCIGYPKVKIKHIRATVHSEQVKELISLQTYEGVYNQ